MRTSSSFGRHIATVLVCCVAATPVAAQSAGARSTTSAGWQFKPALSTTEEFDNNVFLLSDQKKAKLGAGAPVGTRYAGMPSASDIITSLRGTLAFEGPGLGGRRLQIVPELGYDLYARNAERRSSVYGLTIAQKIARGGLFRVKAGMQPQTFHKNYLLDATDRDASRSITPDERFYAPTRQGETTVAADYLLRLRKQDKTTPLGVALRFGGGWYSLTNTAAFASRDLTGPTADVKLMLRTSRPVRVDIGYALASLSAPRVRNVAIIDEATFDRDFNGNGTITDLDARAFEMVDRSRSEHELNASFGTDVGRADVEFEVARRMRSFGSNEPYDIANNGRSDVRNEFGGVVRYDISAALKLRAAAQRSAQTVNRASAASVTGDVADYTRLRGSIGLEYRF